MGFIKRIYHFVVDAKIPTLSGALCFFLLINGGSYLFLFVSVSSYFFIDLIPYVEESMSSGIVKEVILYLFHHNSNLSISITLLSTSIYSSSGLYYHFMHICEVITKRPLDYKFSKRFQAIVLVPIVMAFLLFMLVLFSILKHVLQGFVYGFYMLFLLMLLYVLNKIALRKTPFLELYKGILFSFLYILFFTFFFVLYLNFASSFKIVYGVLSLSIIFLFYLYSFIIGIFLGIYMNCKKLQVWKYFFNLK